MLVGSFFKDPAAVLDYYMDWTSWLGGDTIVDSAWVATGSVTLSQEAIVGSMTQVWVDGGTVGELIDLTNHIVTLGGREDERTLRLILRN